MQALKQVRMRGLLLGLEQDQEVTRDAKVVQAMVRDMGRGQAGEMVQAMVKVMVRDMATERVMAAVVTIKI